MRHLKWVGLVLVLTAPLILPPFYVTLLNFVAIGALTVLGLYLLTGLAGMTSFGQAAFMGIAAYTTALVTTRYGMSPWVGLVAGLIINLACAALLGLVTVRLKGHFLGLATISWQVALSLLAGNLPGLGGHTGIGGLPPVSLGGFELVDDRHYYYLAWGITLAAIAAVARLARSRTGRAIRALRGGALAAAGFGVNPARLKLQVFLLASTLAGVGGWLYAHLMRFVNSTPFALEASIKYVTMGVVGGIGTIPGALFGTVVVTGLEHWLQDLLPSLLGQSGNLEIIVHGLLLVLILYYMPQGIWPLIEGYLPRPRFVPPQAGGLPPPEHPAEPGDEFLEVRRAKKAFGGVLAANDLSFTVPRGEVVALIGPNGAGKSTCFNLITGVLQVTSGEILFKGERISGRAPFEIARLGIARTFQHPHLFPGMTVLENVALGTYLRTRAGMFSAMVGVDRAEESRALAEAYRCLELVGMERDAGERAGALPVGKQRLLEVARALAAGPELLLLDEPAAGLRSGEKKELAALLRRLCDSGITILLVEHDMDLVMGLVDRAVVMNYGEMLAEGTPHEIRQNPKVIEAYLGSSMTDLAPAGGGA